MIINHPTGSYRLPASPDDATSVTYLVSNTEPPRSDLLAPRIPRGIELRGQNVEPPDQILLQDTYGQLAFVTSQASRTNASNNYSQYVVGDILEFKPATDNVVDPMLVSKSTQTQFNLVQTDFAAIGLTAEEQAAVVAEIAQARVDFTNQLNALKQSRANAEIQINTLQKNLNDVVRSISVLESIGSTVALDKLKAAKITLEADVAAAVAAANLYASQANDVATRLRQLQVLG